MEGFQAVLGFILGVVIFLIILSKLRVIFMSYYVMIFFFFISLCLGMILAKFLSWLVIILIIIGIIAFIYIKLHSGSPPESDGKTDESSESSENEESGGSDDNSNPQNE